MAILFVQIDPLVYYRMIDLPHKPDLTALRLFDLNFFLAEKGIEEYLMHAMCSVVDGGYTI